MRRPEREQSFTMRKGGIERDGRRWYEADRSIPEEEEGSSRFALTDDLRVVLMYDRNRTRRYLGGSTADEAPLGLDP